MAKTATTALPTRWCFEQFCFYERFFDNRVSETMEEKCLHERSVMEARLLEWLSVDNLNRAYGKTREQIFDAFSEKGLIGIYNLGMKHMYEYLKSTFTLSD